jgi:hypothetical protein
VIRHALIEQCLVSGFLFSHAPDANTLALPWTDTGAVTTNRYSFSINKLLWC